MTLNDELTQREREVIELVAIGKSNKQVSRELHISPETTKYNLKSIFQKLEAKNRTHAAFVYHGRRGITA